MATFKNLKELERYVNAQTRKAISKRDSNTVNTVITKGKDKVQEVVYDVYDPKEYERSEQLKNNWFSHPTMDGVAIENVRIDEETGKNVTYTVVSGQGYDFPFEYSGKPRDFIQATRDDLAKGNELKKAVAEDLKSVGINVK